MSQSASGMSSDTEDSRARQLRQQIAQVRKRLEAASERPPLEGPGLMEIAREMDRLVVQYTRLEVERKRRDRMAKT